MAPRLLIMTLLIVLGGSGVLAGALRPADRTMPTIKWHKSFAAAKAASRESGLSIFAALCTADRPSHSPSTRIMKKEVFRTEQFKKWAAQHVVLWDGVRTKAEPLKQWSEFVGRNAIGNAITVMLIDADENRLASTAGYKSGSGPKPGSGLKPLIDWLERCLRKLERRRAEALGKELQPPDQGDVPPKTVPAAVLTTGTGKQGSLYPRAVEKELYAGTVLRGREAPPLEVDQWLGNRPETEGMVDLYRTTSKPCRDLVAKLNDFQRKYRDDLVVIALSDEQPADLHEFIRSQMIDYAMGVDSEGRLIRDLAVEAVPHVLVILSDGVVRWQGYPFSKEDPLTNEVIAKIIDAGR